MKDLYRTAIEREIRSRRSDELWYRRTHWADWSDLRKENAAILAALRKIRRDARLAERRAEQRDPLTMGKGWTESERAFAWGR